MKDEQAVKIERYKLEDFWFFFKSTRTFQFELGEKNHIVGITMPTF